MRVVIPIEVADDLIRDGSANSTDARAQFLPGGIELAGILTVWTTAASIVKLTVAESDAAGLLARSLASWRPDAYEHGPNYGYEISARMPTGAFRFELTNPPDVESLEQFLADFFAKNWDFEG